jgi:GcrA cell cycle regulator
MTRTPFELSFEDLVGLGERAGAAARAEAENAGVEIAKVRNPRPIFKSSASAITSAGWTDERADLLKKLWADGLSVSQIARQLGGVTRNNVIGKVHRLGLSSNRPKTRPFARVTTVHEGNGIATVLTLGSHMCKWPIGDPALDNFTFCGRRTEEGAYCAEHALVAYAPATSGSGIKKAAPAKQAVGKYVEVRPRKIASQRAAGEVIELRRRVGG